MKRRFRKMHQQGNDFVIFDGRQAPVEMTGATARAAVTRGRGRAAHAHEGEVEP